MTEPATYNKPLPEPTPVSQPFWDAAREHRLLIQRSKRTGKFIYYPRAVSPFGDDDELEWTEVSGKGKVYAFTIARRPTGPQWAPECPYVIAIVELAEGPSRRSSSNFRDSLYFPPERTFSNDRRRQERLIVHRGARSAAFARSSRALFTFFRPHSLPHLWSRCSPRARLQQHRGGR